MDQGVGAVRGVGGAEVGGPSTHLVFEGWEATDVVDAALLVEGGDGFCPYVLAVTGAHGLDGRARSTAFLMVDSAIWPPALSSTTIMVAPNLS